MQRVGAGRPEPALRRAPPQLVTPGTRAAPACTASGPGPTSPPSAPRRPLSCRPRGLAGHLRFSVATEATGVWVVPPLGLRDERAALRVTLVPRTGCSRVPCSFVPWWPHQNQRRHQQRSKSLFTETHLPLPENVPREGCRTARPTLGGGLDSSARLPLGRRCPEAQGPSSGELVPPVWSTLPLALSTSDKTGRVNGRWAPVLGQGAAPTRHSGRALAARTRRSGVSGVSGVLGGAAWAGASGRRAQGSSLCS